MKLVHWIKQRTARAPLTSSEQVATELRRAREANERVARHRPMRTTDPSFDPRNGTTPTP